MPKINLSFLRNRTVIGVICVVAAIVFGFVLIPVATGLSGTSVVRATENISDGTKITSDMVKTVRVGSLGLQTGTLHSIQDVVGKYAATDLSASDNVTSSKISASDPTTLQPGEMKMSVTIKNFAAGLSGKLGAGDIVAVFCPQSVVTGVSSGDTVQSALYPKELQYVKVAAVTASTGKDTDPQNYQTSSSTSTSNLPASVTLIVNAKQAAVLAGMDNLNVHLAYVCSGKDKQAKSLLQQQTDDLAKEASASAATQAASSSSSASQTESTVSSVSSEVSQ